MSTTAYFRCNGGDFFRTRFCPFDGWASPTSMQFYLILRAFAERGEEPSRSALKAAGLGDHALQRVLFVEFGDEENAFDALSPEGYVIEGEWRPINALGAYAKLLK